MIKINFRGKWTAEVKQIRGAEAGEWVSPDDFPDNFLPAPCKSADQLRAFQLHSFFWYVGQGWIDRDSVQATIRTDITPAHREMYKALCVALRESCDLLEHAQQYVPLEMKDKMNEWGINTSALLIHALAAIDSVEMTNE